MKSDSLVIIHDLSITLKLSKVAQCAINTEKYQWAIKWSNCRCKHTSAFIPLVLFGRQLSFLSLKIQLMVLNHLFSFTVLILLNHISPSCTIWLIVYQSDNSSHLHSWSCQRIKNAGISWLLNSSTFSSPVTFFCPWSHGHPLEISHHHLLHLYSH